MPSVKNQETLTELKSILAEKKNFVVTTYSGLTVEQITDLRGQVREQAGKFKVIKNNLFRIALKETGEHDGVLEKLEAELKGPLAVAFIEENMPGLSKALVKYAKDSEPVEIKAGCMDGGYLSGAEVKQIATLPSREEMLGIIGRGLNTPATKIATGINQIMGSLARGIKAVAEKNGQG